MTDLQETLSRLTLLYVDDDGDMWKLLERTLRRRMKEVFYAPDGEAGLAAIHAHAPDVVVTDLCMPRLSGPEMIRQARAELRSPPPFIIVSAHSDDEADVSLADGRAEKPLEIPKLLGLIAELAAGQ